MGLLSGIAVFAAVAIPRAFPRRSKACVPLAACFSRWEDCLGDDACIEGAYVPASLVKTAACPAELTLQSPGGTPAGKLRVCTGLQTGATTVDVENACYSYDQRMPRVVANGYYTVKVRGHLLGSVFRADEVLVGGCESSYYAWRHGAAAVRERE